MEQAEPIEVIGIKEKDTHRVIFCPLNELGLDPGDMCIFESAMGIDLGRVVTKGRLMSPEYLSANEQIAIIRKATADDIKKDQINSEKAVRAFEVCREKILLRNLPMKLIKVKYMLDSSKAIFFFTADTRIDFRELVRDLAAEFKCRIEMKQIGVRDEARMIGGFGGCGRMLCCALFLRNFDTVSIKMAKEQGLTLIPTKISGMCGRLMCCLMYEYHTYREMRKRIPKIGKRVETPLGPGRLIHLHALKGTFIVELENGQTVELKIPDSPDQPPELHVIPAENAPINLTQEWFGEDIAPEDEESLKMLEDMEDTEKAIPQEKPEKPEKAPHQTSQAPAPVHHEQRKPSPEHVHQHTRNEKHEHRAHSPEQSGASTQQGKSAHTGNENPPKKTKHRPRRRRKDSQQSEESDKKSQNKS